MKNVILKLTNSVNSRVQDITIGKYGDLNSKRYVALTKKYHCPRCKNEKIIEYDDSFDCPICRLEFEKKNFEIFEDDEILAVEEKVKIVKTLLDDD